MRLIAVVLLTTLFATPAGWAQTTQPAAANEAKALAAMELRATNALNAGDYGIALPLLQRLAERSQDDPERLGRVREQIRVCQRELARLAPLDITAPAGAAAEEVPSGAADRVPHAPPVDGQVRPLTIKQLGNFEYDEDLDGSVPSDVLALNGSTVRIVGFMIPMDQAANITQFALVPDLFACCFGQPPQIQHTVVVNCPPGKAVGYYPDELSVEGTLRVEEKKEDGFTISLFELNATSVKPAVR